MAEQEYSKRDTSGEESESSPTENTSTNQTETNSELANELDNLLDDIDSVLETNAEEFVKSYVQKGGQLLTRTCAGNLKV